MKEEKYDKIVVETQVLGEKTPQSCIQKKNAQKFGDAKKKKNTQKFGNAKKKKNIQKFGDAKKKGKKNQKCIISEKNAPIKIIFWWVLVKEGSNRGCYGNYLEKSVTSSSKKL